MIADYTYDAQNNPVTMTRNGITYYYHLNGHDDVIALSDENGQVVAEYDYDAWGNILSQSGSMAEENPYRYAGCYYDEETGLYYLRARYYDPEIGRFIRRDTVQKINQYAYAENNPVMLIDPSGLDRIYYNSKGKVIKRIQSFWNSYYIQSSDGSNFWRLEGSLGDNYAGLIENGDEIFWDFVNQRKGNPLIPWMFTISEVLKKSPSGADWDMKKNYINKVFIFQDQAYKADTIGNIAWGYIMASRGWPLGISLMGGGFAQTILDNTTTLGFWLTNFINLGDDPRDSRAIRMGYQLYWSGE
ncbi:RHS repeat-associated protein [Orenia metallireducens]|uniref:RHS repeat-associated core domain-containing protein n=1 Tax=Orenia metallireducens TaxID=1413210 RepID=A0A285HSY9_9FIRM|nr:RHS repeat-associated core domain-containing protein [Orenia metallireducens]PRX24061.1 RHS repeat-associated protein [Orenia metallireducens]SNY38789.1 RHS repeat-associated core domain-containing protein [Orenia metallireducens]